ncbi:uncharacterized protein LOC132037999 [Lycium ferocissimum]|uniref:uncharacterized protein LOC132037999 n=1 Tax=Lycium ferocissimum TaxID=112874 RepID=UPI0028162A13|nr:uncharacterized protein LOC132037999 [Lycium ferocissimum]
MKMKREGGVIISVYVESSSTKDYSQHGSNPFKKKIHPNPFSRKRGYDRRAQLLAYANELRHGNYQQISWKSHNSSNQKHKKWRWTRRIRSSFSRLFRRNDKQWRYEHIGRQGCKGEKRKAHFCNRLKCFFKDILGAWQFTKQS